jgi:DNA-binding SARP family transcriptional activator
MRIAPQPFDENVLAIPSPVAISLLGAFKLTLGGDLASISNGSKSEQLLFCLALAAQHRVPRTHLLERVWPHSDQASASQSLNSLTYQLNKMTDKLLNGTGMIIHEQGYYRLNCSSGVWVDIDQFTAWSKHGKTMLSRGDVASGVAYCEHALTLYAGDLCGDSDIQTIIERERLRVIFLDLLADLADYYVLQQDLTTALCYNQRLLDHDPCSEEAHRLAMRCYMHLGRRAQAFRQYHICCQALASEFDAKPEPATQALFEQIRLDPASV